MKKYIILFIAVILLSGCNKSEKTLTINGMYIGKKLFTIPKYKVMDADYLYSENHVGYDIDKDKRVVRMVFYRTESALGKESYGLSDAKLFYHGKHLDTTEKVIECFGKDYVPNKKKDYETIKYEDDELIVEVHLYKGEFSSIIVEQK